jgi:hypothetical protein
MKKNSCTGDHKNHLCTLAAKDQIEEIKKLAKKPHYVCYNCGRVAEAKMNLCNPMPLQ